MPISIDVLLRSLIEAHKNLGPISDDEIMNLVQAQGAKPERPHQFWRAVFASKRGFPIRLRNKAFSPYDLLPPIRLTPDSICAGPICTTAEMAEQLAIKKEARMEIISRRNGYKTWGIKFVRPIKVNQEGEPL